MEARKSNFGTDCDVNSHGTGPARGIEHTGTGNPNGVNQHGTGPVGRRYLRMSAQLIVGLAILLVGVGNAVAEAVRYHHQNGLTILMTPESASVSWVRSDGLMAVARGPIKNGMAELPVALISVDRFGKVQNTGTGGGKVQNTGTGGKVQNTGTGGKVQNTGTGGEAVRQLADYRGGELQLLIDESVSGTISLDFGDQVSEIVFEFDDGEAFARQGEL